MNHPAPTEDNITRVSGEATVETVASSPTCLTVLVATAEPSISASMRELLEGYPIRTIWARGVNEVRLALAKESVLACFCGFWLIDGTYREVVSHLKRQPIEIPAIVVCEPSCPQEYRDYLAAMNLRAFDFLCHPYRKMDLERILEAAISKRGQSIRAAQSPVRGPVHQSDMRKAG